MHIQDRAKWLTPEEQECIAGITVMTAAKLFHLTDANVFSGTPDTETGKYSGFIMVDGGQRILLSTTPIFETAEAGCAHMSKILATIKKLDTLCWKLEGFDTFEGEPYPLPGEYEHEHHAQGAAAIRLKELERSQPTAQSGGQSAQGIQDRVYIIRPDGTKYRYTGTAATP